MLLLFYFLLLLLYIHLKKDSSIAKFLIYMQIASLLGTLLIDADYSIDSIHKSLNLIITALILSLIILPWSSITSIESIKFENEIKLKRLTYFLLASSVIPFVIFSVVSAFVFVYIDDINNFKYAENVSTDFYYSLPINTKLLILSINTYYLSIFLIPLHFYYLGKSNYKLSLYCFILSLNLPLHGLMFFSRASLVTYFLIYFSFLYILFNTLDLKTKRVLKKFARIATLLLIIYLLYVSNSRFSEDLLYAETIPGSSFIQNPVIYSYLDYLSQWYRNGMHVLSTYNFETFYGRISLQPLLDILGHFNIINYNADDLLQERKKLWPLNWYTFNGFVAYSIYDYGYLATIIMSFLYFYLIRKLKPKTNHINIRNLFILVIFIQIPLSAIFYSAVSGLIFSLLFLIPIYGYLKFKWI